jgi:hypothetical protein
MSDVTPPTVGEEVWIAPQVGYQTVEAVQEVSENTYLFKTKGDKGDEDYQVRIRNEKHRAYSIEYTRFAIDIAMKYQNDREKANEVFDAIVRAWDGEEIDDVLDEYDIESLPGYDLDFILYALDWIMENEDKIFHERGRSDNKQEQIDEKLAEHDIEKPSDREGSQLAMGLFAGIIAGNHPVDELYDADLL